MEIAPIPDAKGIIKDTIVIPTVNDFTIVLIKEFKQLYGVRKLLSFIERCQGSGPWRETIKGRQRDSTSDKYFTYSRYELELVDLQKLIKRSIAAGVPVDPNKEKRLNELHELMSPMFSMKTDEELELIVSDYIESLAKPG